METIYLVRHGEALDDVEDRYGGWSDDPLTEKVNRQLENWPRGCVSYRLDQ